jgi:hypothetical protein
MAPSAPLIQRLQSHQGKTRRMLTLGKKDSAGQHHTGMLGLNAWGAQKYSKIAENIRFLREERPGSFSSQKINLIGKDIPAKFANPASLLHVKPASTQQDSIWSKVEQVLPAGEAIVPESRTTAAEAGVMRAGTVIQRMPTVPRPGQSIESFKEQVQARAATKPKTPARIPPRAKNDLSVRRYARIEEIPQKTTATPAEDSTRPDSTPTAESAPGDTIRRQVETETDRPLTPESSKLQPKTTSQQTAPPSQPAQTAKPSAPLSQESRPSQPPTEAAPTSSKKPETASPSEAKPVPTQRPISTPNAATEPPTSAPQESEPVERETLPRLTFSQSNTVAPDAPPAEKLTLADKPLPRARPKTREVPGKKQTPEQRSLPQAKASPRPQAVSQPALTRAEPRKPAAAQPQINRAGTPMLQRQPDSTGTTPPPRFISEQSATPSTPPNRVREITTNDDPRPTPPIEPSAETGQAALAPLNMPAIQYRREAPEQVRILKARNIKPVVQPEIFKPSQPLIQRTVESSRPATKSAAPQTGENFPVSRTQAALPARPDTLPQGAPQPAQETIPMPVAHLPQPAPAVTSQPATPPQQSLEIEPAPPPASLPETTPAPIKTTAKNVVQRLWDEHSPPASASGQGSNAASDESSQTGSGLDLDKIAEEVLPIVKRLIEIESERSAGYLR